MSLRRSYYLNVNLKEYHHYLVCSHKSKTIQNIFINNYQYDMNIWHLWQSKVCTSLCNFISLIQNAHKVPFYIYCTIKASTLQLETKVTVTTLRCTRQRFSSVASTALRVAHLELARTLSPRRWRLLLESPRDTADIFFFWTTTAWRPPLVGWVSTNYCRTSTTPDRPARPPNTGTHWVAKNNPLVVYVSS